MTSIHNKDGPIQSGVLCSISSQLLQELRFRSKYFFGMANTSLSERVPVPGLQVTYDGGGTAGARNVPILAVEIGFTESAKAIKEVMGQILDNPDTPHLKAGITVDIKEDPPYENPLLNAQNAVIEQGPPLPVVLDFDEGPDGSLWKFGIRWVGSMTATVQVWKKDPNSGKAVPGKLVVSRHPHSPS